MVANSHHWSCERKVHNCARDSYLSAKCLVFVTPIDIPIFHLSPPLYIEKLMLHSIKSKLKSKVLTSSGDKERVKRGCTASISGLQTTLRIAKGAAGNAAVPGLETGISGLIYILGAIKVRWLHIALRIL
jgi:hypothetical protein